jgi:hypothetical protein
MLLTVEPPQNSDAEDDVDASASATNSVARLAASSAKRCR